MLRLLLDEHVAPALATQLRTHEAAVDILSLQEWEGGRYLRAEDGVLLQAAHAQRRTLITYDRRTITPLLSLWGEQDIPHSGVIFVDRRSLAPNDIGGLLRALLRLWKEQAEQDWTNRVVFLARSAGRHGA